MSHTLFIGTYTQQLPHVQGNATGIYAATIDPESGVLTLHHATTGIVNPSFVVPDPAHGRLFAVQETAEFGSPDGIHTGTGGLSAFAMESASGILTLINEQPSYGAHPCYVSLDQTGHWLLVANYSGGSIAVLPIGPDGALGPAATVITHSAPPQHPDTPHPHAILQSPDGAFVLVPDCGLDRVYVYRFDTGSGALTPNDPPWATLTPGAGPRHLAFHPQGWVYVINERNSTLSVFDFDTAHGVLHERQTLSSLPDDFSGRNSCADLHIHPHGHVVYGSNRGHDSIAIFAVNPSDGTLTPCGHTHTGGRTPRNFAIDPGGTLLLAANQDSNTITSFLIDPTTGALTPVHRTDVPTPVCLRVLG